tara:strand:+ start:188 stop:607 length:420 start_codon:yes stop_codon:yes gene_type:complete
MQQVTATPGPLRDLQRKQKSQVASVATVPTEPARTKYLSNDNNEKSDFPISSATSLNSTLFISTTSTSNDPAAPLVIEKNNSSNNALCTPHFKMLCGGCADRKDRSKTVSQTSLHICWRIIMFEFNKDETRSQFPQFAN